MHYYPVDQQGQPRSATHGHSVQDGREGTLLSERPPACHPPAPITPGAGGTERKAPGAEGCPVVTARARPATCFSPEAARNASRNRQTRCEGKRASTLMPAERGGSQVRRWVWKDARPLPLPIQFLPPLERGLLPSRTVSKAFLQVSALESPPERHRRLVLVSGGEPRGRAGAAGGAGGLVCGGQDSVQKFVGARN